MAGSKGYTGAAALASESALRTGAGLVTLAVPESLNHVMEEKITEVITLPYPDLVSHRDMKKAETIIMKAIEGCRAMAIGPGSGRSSLKGKLMRAIIRKAGIPLVLDADALVPDIVHEHASRSVILTPHPGEMARLLEISTGGFHPRPGRRHGSRRDRQERASCLRSHREGAEGPGSAALQEMGAPELSLSCKNNIHVYPLP